MGSAADTKARKQPIKRCCKTLLRGLNLLFTDMGSALRITIENCANDAQVSVDNPLALLIVEEEERLQAHR